MANVHLHEGSPELGYATLQDIDNYLEISPRNFADRDELVDYSNNLFNKIMELAETEHPIWNGSFYYINKGNNNPWDSYVYELATISLYKEQSQRKERYIKGAAYINLDTIEFIFCSFHQATGKKYFDPEEKYLLQGMIQRRADTIDANHH
jgi:hypothetical protein